MASATKLGQWGAVLWRPWKAGAAPDAIVGQWAEDDSTYGMTVPHQLRDSIIDMQNFLCAKDAEVEALKKQVKDAEFALSKALAPFEQSAIALARKGGEA